MRIKKRINREVLATAKNFYKASLFLEKNGFASPTIVNAVFACEIFLKAFNADLVLKGKKYITNGVFHYTKVSNTPNSKHHYIFDLFNELDKNIKEEILQQYKKNSIMNEDIENLLNQINTAFIEWRYPFEQNNNAINISELFILLSVLDNVATNIYNSLDKTGEF